MSGEFAVALVAVLLIAALIAAIVVVQTRRVVATPAERAVHATLHTAAMAARALRKGLDADSARAAVPHLRDLTGAEGVALYDHRRNTAGPRSCRRPGVERRNPGAQ